MSDTAIASPAAPDPKLPSTAALIGSLGSTLCPTCQGRKNARLTVCGRCYSGLTDATRRALYRRVGNGYEEAVTRAMRELSVDTFHVPPAFASRS